VVSTGEKSTSFRTSGVFCEPFEPGICVEDFLTPSHRLIFNKYPVQDCHILVTTREKELQSTPLTFKDFEASLIAMKCIHGVLFFNSGPISGSSQQHKHVQFIPYHRDLPIDDRVDEVARSTTDN
jgi:ATP adenylyltransferase